MLLNLPLRFIALLLIATSLLSGCNRSERDTDLETLTARENALAYHIFDDAFREVHRFAMRDSLINDTGINQWFNSCIVKTIVSDTVAVFPLYLTINYGGDGITCDDGFLRYGKLLAAFTGKYLNKGTVVTITFDGYRKDVFDVDGTMTIYNLGLNEDGHMRYSWYVEEGKITGINTNIDWNGTHSKIWIAGRSFDSQGKVDDDIYTIDGYAEGRNSRGNTFTNTVTEPYVADFSCQWFTTGQSTLTIPNLQTRYIKYGESTDCDNLLYERRDQTFIEVDIPYED